MRTTILQCRQALIDELDCVYSGEIKMIEVLPSLWAKTQSPELAALLRQFLRESHAHVLLLGEMQRALGSPDVKMHWEGLMASVDQLVSQISESESNNASDLALVGGLIRIKGLKIAGYSVARSLAENLQISHTMTIIIKMILTEMEGELELFRVASDMVHNQ